MSQTGVQTKEESVPTSTAIWISAADGSMGILQAVIGGGALTYYYTRVMGLDPALAGLVWLIFGIWNAVNDPLFGYIADRTRSKLGRRKPYIRYGAPLVLAAFISLWIPFSSGPAAQWALFAQLLLCLFLYDTLYTAIASAIYVMPYEVAISNKARSKIFLWKILFFAISTAAPLILLPIIQPGPGDDPTSFRLTMGILAVAMTGVIFASTWFYNEKHYLQDEESYGMIKSILECFANKAFLIFLVVSFTVIYVQTDLMMGVLYYFDEIAVPALPIYLALGVGVITGVLIFVLKREQLGLKRSLLIWLAAFAIGCVTMVSLGKSVIPAVIGFFFIGIGFAGGMYLIPLMNGDVIDFDETRTGKRREGMYAGINSLVTKPSISIAQAAFLWILGLSGYSQTLAKGMQPASAENGILLAWMLIPTVLLAISFVTLFFFPLSGQKWEKAKEELGRIHAEKEASYLESQGFQAGQKPN
jgi:GPH family glycoside/pentoside/hexuronide:cation symporter